MSCLRRKDTKALHAIHIRVPGEPGNEAKMLCHCAGNALLTVAPQDSGLIPKPHGLGTRYESSTLITVYPKLATAHG